MLNMLEILKFASSRLFLHINRYRDRVLPGSLISAKLIFLLSTFVQFTCEPAFDDDVRRAI